jgi:DNA-directed RNA polymerase I and III subunit RPAC1
MAIETIYIQTNTSIIQDEVLSHRLGLIPIKADPRLFADIGEGDEPTDLNTLVFKIEIECIDPAKDPAAAEMVAEDGSYTEKVYSRQLEWVPQGSQAARFPGIFLHRVSCLVSPYLAFCSQRVFHLSILIFS